MINIMSRTVKTWYNKRPVSGTFIIHNVRHCCIIKQLNYGNSFFNKLTKHKKEIKSSKWFCNYCMWLQQDVTNACQSAKWIILNSDMINCDNSK